MPVCAEPSALVPDPRHPAPPFPLPSEVRSDVAYRRAQGYTWEAIGVALRYDPDALRRACAADDAFKVLLEAAEAEAEHEGGLQALRRLRRLTESDDERVAVRAAEVLVRYARERRRERAEPARAPAPRPKVEREAVAPSRAPAGVRPVEANRVRVAPEG